MTGEQALQILREAIDRSAKEKVDTPEVRAALGRLARHCPEHWPLDGFWTAASSPYEIGRAQNTRANFNGILRQLGRAPE